MAPELFQQGSPYSSASDLWAPAVSCMSDSRAGRPPFMSDSLTQLIQDILMADPSPFVGTPKLKSWLLGDSQDVKSLLTFSVACMLGMHVTKQRVAGCMHTKGCLQFDPSAAVCSSFLG